MGRIHACQLRTFQQPKENCHRRACTVVDITRVAYLPDTSCVIRQQFYNEPQQQCELCHVARRRPLCIHVESSGRNTIPSTGCSSPHFYLASCSSQYIIMGGTTGIVLRPTTRYPASTTFLVQLLAAAIGVILVVAICRIINYSLRLRLRKASVSLNIIQTWVNITVPVHVLSGTFHYACSFFFPVLFILFLSLLSAALWAGSFAPNDHRTIPPT